MATFRREPRIPSPATGADAKLAATLARALCVDGAADGPASRFNTALAEALNPLRLLPALGVRCTACGDGIAFIALPTEGITLVSGNHRQPPKRRRGGIYDLAHITDTETPGAPRAQTGWQADAAAGRGPVRVTGDKQGSEIGFAQRRTHTCRNCGRNYTHTNTGLLRKYLDAVARGEPAIHL